ncbi:hypothetical protein Bca52824_004332 [Brassica carinata]|uniref:Uncharacterized protein n=1 Tax=Brassica carinata TaxID=52824 RepID=A0A8X7WPH4_BRACI|nr:hypothetical protein Bca52824_004332 [Brassica carinata]
MSWTDSIDKWLMCGFSKNLWLRRGNVGGRSLCLTSATASLSNLVKLIYLNAVVKVARPSLSGSMVIGHQGQARFVIIQKIRLVKRLDKFKV